MQSEQTKIYRYPGVKPFSEDEKHLFYGRSSDTQKLSHLIRLEKLVVLYGKSGLGKSSLLNAGVLPIFEESEDYKIVKIRFGANYDKLETPLVTSLYKFPDTVSNPILDKLGAGNDTLWLRMKALQQHTGNLLKTYIMVFDQFEELFTYDKEDIKQFKKQLADLLYAKVPGYIGKSITNRLKENPNFLSNEEMEYLYHQPNVKLVLSIRSDRLSLLHELTDYFPDILKNYYELKPLDRKGAMDAISKPASDTNGHYLSPPFEYSEDSVNKIVNYLTEDGEKSIETFQLQTVCQFSENLIIKRNESGEYQQKKLVIKPEDLGNLQLIFREHYDRLLGDIQSPIKKRAARLLIEDKLIINGNRVPLPEIVVLNEEGIDTELITYLHHRHHLLRSEPNTTGGISYEISHDTLVIPILKAKKEREQEEELIRLAEERKENEKFEAAKVKKVKEEIRKRNKRRAWIIVPIILLIAFWAIISQFKINKEKKRVEKLILSRELLSNAASLSYYYGEHKKAMLLSDEAYKIFETNKLESAGENLHDYLYYYRMLFSLKNYLNANGTKADRDSFLEISNNTMNKQNIQDPYGVSTLAPAPVSSTSGSISSSLPVSYSTISSPLSIRPSVVSFTKIPNEENNLQESQNLPPIKTFLLVGPKEVYYLGFGDGTIKTLMKDTDKTYYVKSTNKGSKDLITSSAYDVKRNLLAVADIEGNPIHIYNLNSDSLTTISLDPINVEGKDDAYLAFYENGELLILRPKDNSITKWDRDFKNKLVWDKVEKQEIWVNTNNDGKTYIKEEIPATSIPWNKKSLQIIDSLDSSNIPTFKKLKCISVSKDSKIAIGIENGIILLTPSQYVEIEDQQLGTTRVIKFDETGKYLVVGNSRGGVYSFNILEKNGRIESISKNDHFEHSKRITDIAFRPRDSLNENTVFATSDITGLVVVWEKNNNIWSSLKLDINILQLEEKKEWIDGDLSISFTPSSGNYIIVSYGDYNGTIVKWPYSMKILAKLIEEKLEVEKTKLDTNNNRFKEQLKWHLHKLDSLEKVRDVNEKSAAQIDIAILQIGSAIDRVKELLEENRIEKSDLEFDVEKYDKK